MLNSIVILNNILEGKLGDILLVCDCIDIAPVVVERSMGVSAATCHRWRRVRVVTRVREVSGSSTGHSNMFVWRLTTHSPLEPGVGGYQLVSEGWSEGHESYSLASPERTDNIHCEMLMINTDNFSTLCVWHLLDFTFIIIPCIVATFTRSKS